MRLGGFSVQESSLKLLTLSFAALGLTGCAGTSSSDPSSETPVGNGDPPPGSTVPSNPVELVTYDKEGLGDVALLPVGTAVQLTATPSVGWRFDHWSGAATSTTNPLTIWPTEALSITAHFAENPVSPNSDDEPSVPAEGEVNPGDEDGDEVPDSQDLCLESPRDSAVDAEGCAASQRDSDFDGVTDDVDLCPETRVGDRILATGCTPAESDTDRDGVSDDKDRCPGSVAADRVDAFGCAVVSAPICGNGVIESGEHCDPPNATTCDGSCRLRSVTGTVCGNGVVEVGEQCDPPNIGQCGPACIRIGGAVCGNGTVEPPTEQCEPPNTSICSTSCQSTAVPAPPVCGNGTVETGEQCDSMDRSTCGCNCRRIVAGTALCGNCVREGDEVCDPPNGTSCGLNCRPLGGGSSSRCGNGVIDIGEDCDPPNDRTCDSRCLAIVPRPANDSFDTSIAVSSGIWPFSTEDSTTDGPVFAGEACGQLEFQNDVWFCYAAPANTEVIVSLCGSSFDTMLAVYPECQNAHASAISCNNDGCDDDSDQSEVTFSSIAGHSYAIRVGGLRGETGVGSLHIRELPENDSCSLPLEMGDGMTVFSTRNSTLGDVVQGAPGCPAADFSKDVWFCYTATCSGMTTLDVCDASFNTMLAVYGGCACPTARPIACNDNGCGLGSIATYETVIGQEFLVRIGGFQDAEGVGRVSASCELGDPCGPGNGACRVAHPNPGCDDEDCCRTICDIPGEEFCCTDSWDEECAFTARVFCP